MEIDFGVAFLWFAAFLFSTTVHEAMHAFAGWKGGDPTAYHGGQVSLSPLPHVQREPLGMVVVPLLTAFTHGWPMGWASAPYDPVWAERHPTRAAVMAAAGPAGNAIIALCAFGLLKLGVLSGLYLSPDHVSFEALVETAGTGAAGYAGTALSILLMLNVFLCAFNLLPLPPLDGGAIVQLVLPDAAARTLSAMQSHPLGSTIGLLIAWRVFPVLTDPLFSAVLRLLHSDATYS